MIGLDSSVIIRYISKSHDAVTQDLTQRAVTFVDSLSVECPGFITLVSLVELVATLQTGYMFKKGEVIEFIETLLRSKEMVVENAEIVWQAVRVFAASEAGFSACLNERNARSAGCRYMVSLDPKAAKYGGIRSL